MRLKLKAKLAPAKSQLNVDLLGDPVIHQKFELAMRLRTNRFMCLPDELDQTDIETHWTAFKNTTLEAAREVCGVRRRNKDKWVSNMVEQLSEAKDSLFMKWQSTHGRCKSDDAYLEYKKAKRECAREVRRAKAELKSRKARELEKHAKDNNTRAMYQAVREMGGARDDQGGTLRNHKGEVILDSKGRMKRWQEHFQQELNVGKKIDEKLLEELGKNQLDRIGNFEPPPPVSKDEVLGAIKQLKSHKAPGVDGIHAEILKAGGDPMATMIHRLIEKIWEKEQVPEDWRKAVIVPLFKKGDKSLCENWRGISLLSVVGKVFTRLLLNRLIHFTDSQLSEIQAGFRAGRSCADQVFTMRRTIEMTRRENIPIYACFIDLKAAYDSVNREALWRIVSDYGLPGKECRLIQSLYQGTSAAVRCEGGLTDWFEVRTGLRQGCMLSPALFNIFIDFVVRKALIGKEAYGLEIEYSLPDGRRYRGDKVDGQDHLLALLYADDLVVTCRTEEGLRACVESLEDKTQMWGLSISAVSYTHLTLPTICSV